MNYPLLPDLYNPLSLQKLFCLFFTTIYNQPYDSLVKAPALIAFSAPYHVPHYTPRYNQITMEHLNHHYIFDIINIMVIIHRLIDIVCM